MTKITYKQKNHSRSRTCIQNRKIGPL